jgi:hypothetical protein
MRFLRLLKWWLGAESNRRHKDFQSSALPTELPSQTIETICITSVRLLKNLIAYRRMFLLVKLSNSTTMAAAKLRMNSIPEQAKTASGKLPKSAQTNAINLQRR